MCVCLVCVSSLCVSRERDQVGSSWGNGRGCRREEGSLGSVSSLYRQDPVRINGYSRSQAPASTAPYPPPRLKRRGKFKLVCGSRPCWLKRTSVLLLHLLQITRPNLTEPVWLTWEGWASLPQNSEAALPPGTASHRPRRARLPGQPGPPPPLWVFRHVQDSSVRSKHRPPRPR